MFSRENEIPTFVLISDTKDDAKQVAASHGEPAISLSVIPLAEGCGTAVGSGISEICSRSGGNPLIALQARRHDFAAPARGNLTITRSFGNPATAVMATNMPGTFVAIVSSSRRGFQEDQRTSTLLGLDFVGAGTYLMPP
jgi:hypothetical protein